MNILASVFIILDPEANLLLAFLKRNLIMHQLQHRSKNSYIYKQLLLLSIEYCSAIWDPYHHIDKYKLEMIQQYAARFVLNKPWHRQQQSNTTTDTLTYLKWPSLEDRR